MLFRFLGGFKQPSGVGGGRLVIHLAADQEQRTAHLADVITGLTSSMARPSRRSANGTIKQAPREPGTPV